MTLGVSLGGWIDWKTTAGLVRQFDNLRRLALFDNTLSSDMLLCKGKIIEKDISKIFRNRQEMGVASSGPEVYLEDIPAALEWEGDIADWIT